MDSDLSSYFDADAQKAQERYQAALSAGYDPETAASLYLAPSQVKRKIIEAHPDDFQDPGTLGQIDSDFDSAISTTVKNMGRDDSASQLVLSQMTPLAQKWGAMTAKTKIDDPAVAAALDSVRSGGSVLDAVTNDPNLLKSSSIRSQIRLEMNGGGKKQGKGEYDKARLALAHKKFLDATDNTARDAAAAILQQYDSGLPSDESQPATTLTDSGDATQPLSSGAFGWLGNESPSTNINDILAAAAAKQSAPAPQQSAATVLANPQGRFFISGQNGQPDLTNYEGGRAGADAAWVLAHPNIEPQPADEDWSNPDHVAQLPDSGTPAPKTSKSSSQFKDKSGKVWNYVGDSDNPTSDHNPDNWELAQ
jgi:hypothetical protein